MVKFWRTGCLLALGALSTARAVCNDLDIFLDVSSPLTGDQIINVNVGVIECEIIERDRDADEVVTIVVEGGTLTIASDNTVQFINVAFLVMPGAAIVFDMPETLFGPNNDVFDADARSGWLIDVSDGSSLTFNGDVTFREIGSSEFLLRVFGRTEFKKTVVIEDNPGGMWVISGNLRFDGDATFRGNDYVNIINSDGGFVRFSSTATFDGSSSSDPLIFPGCVISNQGSTSKMSFRGDAYIINNTRCTNAQSPPVFNRGFMTFAGEAHFNDNRAGDFGGAIRQTFGSMTFRSVVQFNNNFSEFNGGGLAVSGGDVTFRSDVQFNNNLSEVNGGGLSVSGGDVTFRNAVTFSDNIAEESGGAFAVLFRETSQTFGSLTFEEPTAVRFSGNTVDTTDENGNDCTVGEVEEGTMLIGFPGDDVCVRAS